MICWDLETRGQAGPSPACQWSLFETEKRSREPDCFRIAEWTPGFCGTGQIQPSRIVGWLSRAVRSLRLFCLGQGSVSDFAEGERRGGSNSQSIQTNQWLPPKRISGHASPHPAPLVPFAETGRRNRDLLSGYGGKVCRSEIPAQVERRPCIGLASACFRDHESAMFTGRPRYSDQFGSIEGTGFRLCRRVEISRVCKGGSPIGHRQFGFGSEKQATSRT